MSSFSSLICVTDCYDSNAFIISISTDYNVYSYGNCKYRSYGHEEEQIFIPTEINNLSDVKMIDCGKNHTICLDINGNIYSFGKNFRGELGIGNFKVIHTHIPQKIKLPSCKQVSCGHNFTICLTEDNKLYSFGRNDHGQLGLGNYNNVNAPRLIRNFSNLELIACGGYHSICKTYNGEIYSWGFNENGQLGCGNYRSYTKPIKCKNWPDNIISIKCGSFSSLLLTSEGQVYSCGDNSFGQLGINKKNIQLINKPILIRDIPEIQRIECGDNHSMCIDTNNNLYVFGDNSYGQLGLGDTKHRYKPILHPILPSIRDISSRGNHTIVKTLDNKIYSFGYNRDLGIETSNEEEKLIPIQVFIDKEDIWCSTIGKSDKKSARK